MAKTKECVLEDKVCTDCGDCDMCDLNPQKTCSNCCQCIEEEGADYKGVYIDDMIDDDKSDLEEEELSGWKFDKECTEVIEEKEK